MLDRTAPQEAPPSVHRRQISDVLVALAFFAAIGSAMMVWIAAIAWVSWRLLEWMLS